MRLTILTLTVCTFLGLSPMYAGDPPAAGTSTQEQPGAEHRSLAHAAHEIKAVIESLEKARLLPRLARPNCYKPLSLNEKQIYSTQSPTREYI